MNNKQKDHTIDRETVIQWIGQRAHPITSLDPHALRTDLEPLDEIVGNAAVVGFGASTRGAHELSTLQHRLLRFLVEQRGFRSLALEVDWTNGIRLDEYVRTGKGDLRALLAEVWVPYRTEEMEDVLRWMSSYNQHHPDDPVRVVGLDFNAVRALAYDAVATYVRRTAPERLGELEGHYEPLRPSGGIDDHVEWYHSQQDKQPFIDHARRAYDLVSGLPAHDGHGLALLHARAIVSFYEYHADGSLAYAEQRLAENAIRWHEHTTGKVVYWGAMAHTANGNPRIVSSPPDSPTTDRNAGSYLRDKFGSEYVSVGLIFHSGSVPYPVPAPPPEFGESALGNVGSDTYLLDLHAEQPQSVREWLNNPTKTRFIGPNYDPENDSAYHMSDGSLADWFDVVVYCQEVTANHPLE